MDDILRKTLAHLEANGVLKNRRIAFIYLSNYFTIVQLSDFTVGACMSSFELSIRERRRYEQLLYGKLGEDPLLMEYTGNNVDNIKRAIRVATTSALSSRLLMALEDNCFSASYDSNADFFSTVEYATVIGFGGLLGYLACRPNMRRLHISDLQYPRRCDEFEMKIAAMQARYPRIQFSVSDPNNIESHLLRSQCVAITGSTLGNGTLDEMLKMIGANTKTVLYGQSASMHPKALFEAGVKLILTTIKYPDLASDALWSQFDGSAMLRARLEGSKHWLYIWPKNAIQS